MKNYKLYIFLVAKSPISTNVTVNFSYVLGKAVLFLAIIKHDKKTFQVYHFQVSQCGKNSKKSQRLKVEGIFTFLLKVFKVESLCFPISLIC